MNPVLKTVGLALLAVCSVYTQPLSAQNHSVTKAEAETLSIQLDTSVSNGNPVILNNLISFPVFIGRLNSRSPFINNFDTLGKIAARFGLYNIGNRTVEMAKNGSYHLVRGYMRNEEVHLLFRVFGDGGLNYQDITLVKVKDSVRAADIFSYQMGESYGTQFAALIEQDKPQDQHRSLTTREKYSGIFENALSNKNYSAARSAFEKFDDATQNDKHLLLQYIGACEHLDKKSYKKSLDRYIALYTDEPMPYLQIVNLYADSKEIDPYALAIDKLDTLLSIDPFLNYLRGNIEMKTGNSVAARDFYRPVFLNPLLNHYRRQIKKRFLQWQRKKANVFS